MKHGRPFKLISKYPYEDDCMHKTRDMIVISKMSPYMFSIWTINKYNGKYTNVIIRTLRNMLMTCKTDVKVITKFHSPSLNNYIKYNRKPISFHQQSTYKISFHDLMRYHVEEKGALWFQGTWRKKNG